MNANLSILASSLVLLAVVGCADDGPAPKPPTPIAARTNDARAPQQAAPHTPQPALPQATPTANSPASPSATPHADAAAKRLSTADSDATIVEIAGFTLPKPALWQWQSPSMQFRALQYSVPGVGEGTGAAEVVFSVFAAGDGGPIDMNIKRWVSQFRADDGSEAVPKIEERSVAGMKVTWLELAGRYQGMGQAAPRPDMKQLGAILQAPDRTVFIRLVGPAATVDAASVDFEKMVMGVSESKSSLP